jgi:hypothetical protein
VLGSVARNGTVQVSRPRPLGDCRPDVSFISAGDADLQPPAWRDGFVPAGVAGPGLVTVGFSRDDLDVAEGAPPVTSVTAFAQRLGGGTLATCAMAYAPELITDPTSGPEGAEFGCTIVGLQAGVAYNVWLVALDAAGESSPKSNPRTLTPTDLPDGDVDVEGSSDGIVVSWTLPDIEDGAGGLGQTSGVLRSSAALVQTQTQSGLQFQLLRRTQNPDTKVWGSPVLLTTMPFDPLRSQYSYVDSVVSSSLIRPTRGVYYEYEVRLVSPSADPVVLVSREVASLAQPTVRIDHTTVVARTAPGGRQRQSMIVAWEPVPGAQSYLVEFSRAAAPGQPATRHTMVVPVFAGLELGALCPSALRCAEPPVALLGRGRYTATVTASTAPAGPRDLSDRAESDERELEESPQAPVLAVRVVENRARLTATNLESGAPVRYRLMRDGDPVRGVCANLGTPGNLQCTDTTAPTGRLVTYQLVAENDVFSVSSNEVSVKLLGALRIDDEFIFTNEVQTGLRLSWSAAGAERYFVYACAAPASSHVTDCPTGFAGTQKLYDTASLTTTFVRTGPGEVGPAFNAIDSSFIWSLGCYSYDDASRGLCPYTRFTVVARTGEGDTAAEVRLTTRAIQALGPATPPRPAPLPSPNPPVYTPPVQTSSPPDRQSGQPVTPAPSTTPTPVPRPVPRPIPDADPPQPSATPPCGIYFGCPMAAPKAEPKPAAQPVHCSSSMCAPSLSRPPVTPAPAKQPNLLQRTVSALKSDVQKFVNTAPRFL